MSSTNLAGRAGRWSTAHWKTAAFGWIAIAVIAVVAGSAVGAKQMKSWAFANGESRRAEQMLADANFRAPARESVLVQSRTHAAGSTAFVAVVRDVGLALSAQESVAHLVLPTGSNAAGLVSKDGHSALVQFDVRGDPEDASDKIAPILAVVDDVQLAHPDFVVGEFSLASADRSLSDRFASDMHRAEYTSVPLTLAILVVAFGALVAAGLPVLLALSAVLAATGLNALASHLIPTDQQTLSAIILMLGMAVGIDYSLFYIRREREGAARRARSARRSAANGAHLRSSRARLRLHGAHRNGRDVRERQLAVLDDRRRDDDRRAGGDDRFVECPAGGAAPSRAERGPASHPTLSRHAAG